MTHDNEFEQLKQRLEDTQEQHSRNKDAVLEHVIELGINPDVVAADSLTPTHYEEFVFDLEGKRVVKDGDSVRERKEWPEGFDYSKVEPFVGSFKERAEIRKKMV